MFDLPEEIWEDNLAAFSLMMKISTQWRVAPMGGYVGIDYNVAIAVMNRMGLSDDEWNEMLDDLAVMEAAALGQLNAKN